MVAAMPASRQQALATVTGVALAGEKENEGEEQAGVGAVAQAPQHQQSCLCYNWKEKICDKRYNCEFLI